MSIKRLKKVKKNVVVDNKKYSVAFKKKIVQEYLTGLKNSQDIHREYGIRFTLLHSWHVWYKKHFLNFTNDYQIMKTKKTEDKARILELEAELLKVLEAYEREKLRAEAMEHLVDLAKQYHQIDLKKSIGKK